MYDTCMCACVHVCTCACIHIHTGDTHALNADREESDRGHIPSSFSLPYTLRQGFSFKLGQDPELVFCLVSTAILLRSGVRDQPPCPPVVTVTPVIRFAQQMVYPQSPLHSPQTDYLPHPAILRDISPLTTKINQKTLFPQGFTRQNISIQKQGLQARDLRTLQK